MFSLKTKLFSVSTVALCLVLIKLEESIVLNYKSLKNGILSAFVYDSECIHYGSDVKFDGFELGIFCASRR